MAKRLRLTKKKKERLRWVLNVGVTDIAQGTEMKEEKAEAIEIEKLVDQYIEERLS